MIQREPTLAPDAPEGFENLYLRDNLSGAFRTVTAVTPRMFAGQEFCVAYAGASAGFGHLLLYTNGALTPDAPEAPGRGLYEWSQSGGLKLVSVLPDGTPAPAGAPFSGFGAGDGIAGCNRVGRPLLRHAISDDGSRIFWSKGYGARELFVREDGTTTVHLGNGRFWAASADGSKAFFGGLNRYDLESEELTNLAPVPAGLTGGLGMKGVFGAADDGTYVYFAATGALAAGATPFNPNLNLYLWHEDPASGESSLTFIATTSDGINWIDEVNQTARVTPDGRHLAFVSTRGLVGNDTTDVNSGEPDSQVYLYDAPSGKLVCASCSPTGAIPTGPSSLPTWSTPYQQPRYLSDDGGRLFFQSRDALSLHDTNGRQDVYMWERQGVGSCTAASAEFSEGSGGCVFPITPGTSRDDSYLVEASSDGRDVFVSTRQRLAPQDEDEAYDLYDARVGGGFPSPPPPAEPCSGDACRAAVGLVPSSQAPGSAGFSGSGNLRHHRRCRAPGRHPKRANRRGKPGRHHPKRASRRGKHVRQASHRVRRCKRSHRRAGCCKRSHRRAGR